MCRNIKTLFNFAPPATEQEIHDASLQFVRKLCGFNAPSKQNQPAFELAVRDITAIASVMLDSLATSAAPKNREAEAERAREGSRLRFGKMAALPE